MCRLALNVAVLALITSLTRSDAAQAFPFSSWSHGHPTFEAVTCRPPSLVPRICAGSSVRVRRFLVVAVLLLSKYGPSLSLPRQANVRDVTSAIGT